MQWMKILIIKNPENIDLNQNIILKNVSYIYPETHDYVLKDFMNIQ